MRKTIIRIVVTVIFFIIALLSIGNIMNRGNTDMTEEMQPASLAVVYMVIDGERVNCLHGYTNQENLCYARENITPLKADRKLSFAADRYGRNISRIYYEVRSVDGARLIEDGQITDYSDIAGTIQGEITIKDLIDLDTEYNFTLILETDGEEKTYYNTRILAGDGYYGAEKLEFVRSFTEKTFDKEEAQNLVKYLESNSKGDNSTLGRVTIHSSFAQVTWADLQIKEHSSPNYCINEITPQTASITDSFVVTVSEGRKNLYYRVEEYFRIRYTVDRIYLIDYERTMDQIVDVEAKDVFVGNKIVLGIQSEDIEIIESDGGNTFAFVTDGRLFAYNVEDSKIAKLYCSYDSHYTDPRELYQAHEVKVLQIDETGNVRFVVYGYMNRGVHEGEVGINVFFYNSATNTIEEEVYIPYDKSYKVLIKEMEQLSYVSKDEIYYFVLSGSIYAVDLEGNSYEVLADDLMEDSFQISPDHSMVVWQDKADVNASDSLTLMNLNNRIRTTIPAENGCYIKPLGFMEKDLIFGIARKEDVITDKYGLTTFGMYLIRIRDENGTILKEYLPEDIYVTDGFITDNQLTMKRAVKNADGTAYVATSDDQIVNNVTPTVGSNTIEKPVTATYETIQQIVLKNDVNSKKFRVLTPKLVLYEGNRTVELEKEDSDPYYYVYAKGRIIGIYAKAADAVTLAYDNAGVVINDSGKYIWLKGTRSTRNQIMAIGASQLSEERGSVAVCMDTVLSYLGVPRNSQYLLDQGENVLMILEEAIGEEYEILDLSGCNMDALLYYVNQDIPILVLMGEEAVLLIGYNDSQVVLMDPQTDSLYKKNITETADWFRRENAVYLSYIAK